ncbi:hypothetical protein M8J75_014135 [Diaphorina citri]|nr:hypothetical protein M8J75_014135 [Diaphorina citri]
MELSEVKIILRGLLMSAKDGLTVKQLLHDFQSEEGAPIPFKEFGFSNVIEFLCSIPDVLEFQSHSPPHMGSLVYPVSTSKSNHIAELVAGQRSKPNKYNRSKSLSQRKQGSRFYTPPQSRGYGTSPRYSSHHEPSRWWKSTPEPLMQKTFSSFDNTDSHKTGSYPKRENTTDSKQKSSTTSSSQHQSIRDKENHCDASTKMSHTRSRSSPNHLEYKDSTTDKSCAISKQPKEEIKKVACISQSNVPDRNSSDTSSSLLEINVPNLNKMAKSNSQVKETAHSTQSVSNSSAQVKPSVTEHSFHIPLPATTPTTASQPLTDFLSKFAKVSKHPPSKPNFPPPNSTTHPESISQLLVNLMGNTQRPPQMPYLNFTPTCNFGPMGHRPVLNPMPFGAPYSQQYPVMSMNQHLYLPQPRPVINQQYPRMDQLQFLTLMNENANRMYAEQNRSQQTSQQPSHGTTNVGLDLACVLEQRLRNADINLPNSANSNVQPNAAAKQNTEYEKFAQNISPLSVTNVLSNVPSKQEVPLSLSMDIPIPGNVALDMPPSPVLPPCSIADMTDNNPVPMMMSMDDIDPDKAYIKSLMETADLDESQISQPTRPPSATPTTTTTSTITKRDREIQFVGKRMHANLIELMAEHPDGIRCSDLPSLYEEKYKVPFTRGEYGEFGLISFVEKLPSVFRVLDLSSCEDWILLDPKQKIPAKYLHRDLIPDAIEEAIVKILQRCRNGFFIDEFPDKYQLYYRRPINLKDYPAFSWGDVVAHCTVAKKIAKAQLVGDRWFFRPLSKDAYRLPEPEVPVVPQEWELHKPQLKHFESKFVLSMDQLTKVELPDTKMCAEVHIILQDGLSPYKLSAILCDNQPSLNEMMDDLNEVYNALGPSELQMEPVHITRGNLLYLDFGTIGYAPSDQLKYMTPDYAILPLQCLYVTLYRVLPIDVDPSTGLPLWNGKGLDRLLTKYENIKVTATVFKYDPKEPRICTWITAVDSDGKIVELNKEFCDWGYGVLDLRSIPLATQLTEDIPIPGTSVNSEPDFDELLERILSRSSTSQPRPPSPDDENNPNSVKNLKEPPAPKKIIFLESEGEEEGEKTKPCGMVKPVPVSAPITSVPIPTSTSDSTPPPTIDTESAVVPGPQIEGAKQHYPRPTMVKPQYHPVRQQAVPYPVYPMVSQAPPATVRSNHIPNLPNDAQIMQVTYIRADGTRVTEEFFPNVSRPGQPVLSKIPNAEDQHYPRSRISSLDTLTDSSSDIDNAKYDSAKFDNLSYDDPPKVTNLNPLPNSLYSGNIQGQLEMILNNIVQGVAKKSPRNTDILNRINNVLHETRQVGQVNFPQDARQVSQTVKTPNTLAGVSNVTRNTNIAPGLPVGVSDTENSALKATFPSQSNPSDSENNLPGQKISNLAQDSASQNQRGSIPHIKWNTEEEDISELTDQAEVSGPTELCDRMGSLDLQDKIGVNGDQSKGLRNPNFASSRPAQTSSLLPTPPYTPRPNTLLPRSVLPTPVSVPNTRPPLLPTSVPTSSPLLPTPSRPYRPPHHRLHTTCVSPSPTATNTLDLISNIPPTSDQQVSPTSESENQSTMPTISEGYAYVFSNPSNWASQTNTTAAVAMEGYAFNNTSNLDSQASNASTVAAVAVEGKPSHRRSLASNDVEKDLSMRRGSTHYDGGTTAKLGDSDPHSTSRVKSQVKLDSQVNLSRCLHGNAANSLETDGTNTPSGAFVPIKQSQNAQSREFIPTRKPSLIANNSSLITNNSSVLNNNSSLLPNNSSLLPNNSSSFGKRNETSSWVENREEKVSTPAGGKPSAMSNVLRALSSRNAAFNADSNYKTSVARSSSDLASATQVSVSKDGLLGKELNEHQVKEGPFSTALIRTHDLSTPSQDEVTLLAPPKAGSCTGSSKSDDTWAVRSKDEHFIWIRRSEAVDQMVDSSEYVALRHIFVNRKHMNVITLGSQHYLVVNQFAHHILDSSVNVLLKALRIQGQESILVRYQRDLQGAVFERINALGLLPKDMEKLFYLMECRYLSGNYFQVFRKDLAPLKEAVAEFMT